jgi:methyltransferase (TIGR00027 family)
VIGAGLDSRPYRLAERLQEIEVFEVDHPASQATKRSRLAGVLGLSPPGVRFVPVDFARDDLAVELNRAGHDQRARTLFVWSGVTPYLPEAAVSAVLGWIGRHESPRTSVAFDAMWASVLDGDSPLYGARELYRSVKQVGEPLRWGFRDGQADETLARVGLRAERFLDADALARYVTHADGTLLARPYGFCVLVHARPS